MRLRTLLAFLFASLLVVTAGSIGWLGYSSSHREAKRFTQHDIAQANAAATHHVLDFLNDPANRLLAEFTIRARRGMLNLRDDKALGFDLAERLRVNPTLAWISYSDAVTGHFVGVWRKSPNDMVLNVSTPTQGRPLEEIIQPDGTTTPYLRPQPDDYDPRGQDWYKNAVNSNTTVWSSRYTFVEGVEGITASRVWRPTDNGAPGGVFTVDFYTKDIEDLLNGVAENLDGTDTVNGISAILGPDGSLICSSQLPAGSRFESVLAAWVKENPGFKDIDGQTTNHLVPIKVDGVEYLSALERVDAPSGLKCIVVGMVPRAAVFDQINHVTGQMGIVVLLALILALLIGTVLSYRISAPLHALGEDMAAVGQFQLAGGNRPRSIVHEVNQLHDASDRMKSGLRSFIKYVPDDLVRRLLSHGQDAVLGGEMRRLTVFFSDIVGFSSRSEKTAPNVLVHELAEYFEVLTRQLRQHSGTIDKFIGDAVMAFWNAPESVPNHENLACRAALMALEELATTQTIRKSEPFGTRVGLHCGEVLVGNIGTPDRFAYTVLGDAVNVASRLESLNKMYGTHIMASGEVYEHSGADFEWRHLDRVAVAGREGGMEIYELMGFNGQVDGTRCRHRDLYEEALGRYFMREFAEAGKIFDQNAAVQSGDKASVLMSKRCSHFLSIDLPADWNGVFAYEIK